MKQSIKLFLSALPEVLSIIPLLIWLPIALTGIVIKTLWEVFIDKFNKR